MVAFDSSLIIDVLRRKKSALDLIESYSGKEKIAVTVISKYEILRGTTEKDMKLVSDLLRHFLILDFEDSAIEEMVKMYKRLIEKGKMVNEFDLLIAGIAAANDEMLITRDRDFLNFGSTKIIVLS